MSKIVFLYFGLFLIAQSTLYGQCTDKTVDKITLDIGREIVTKCSSSPNKLTISTTDCNHSAVKKTGFTLWKINTVNSWEGNYTTLHYSIKLYIELTLDKNARVKSISIYFIDYSDSLIHRCIDLSNTKPLELKPGSVAYYPYIELDPSELE